MYIGEQCGFQYVRKGHVLDKAIKELWVKVAMSQCKTTLWQVDVLHSKSHLSKTTKESAKWTMLSKIKVFIMQNGCCGCHTVLYYTLLLDYYYWCMCK